MSDMSKWMSIINEASNPSPAAEYTETVDSYGSNLTLRQSPSGPYFAVFWEPIHSMNDVGTKVLEIPDDCNPYYLFDELKEFLEGL